jgi:NNMT/PNMT/TEMT family
MQPNTQSTNLADYLDFDAVAYLSQYWPQLPSDSIAWKDNVALMSAYQESALEIRKLFEGHAGLNLLDVGTGPALAPLLAIISELKSAQLSDFHQQNREALVRMPVDYWSNYVPLLTAIFDNPLSMQREIL